MTVAYDQEFYDTIRRGARRSVEATMPYLIEHLHLDGTERVLDVGCGEGWWADGFASLGCTVVGVDSGRTSHRPDTFQFVDQSLDDPLPLGPFDVVVCLEVLEHVRAGLAYNVISQIRERTDCLLFSAAIPGQGGTGHINERRTSDWAARLHGAGFAVSGALRWYLWGNEDIENWYQQNMLVAIPQVLDLDDPPHRAEGLFPPNVPEAMARPHDVVHPVLFNARRS